MVTRQRDVRVDGADGEWRDICPAFVATGCVVSVDVQVGQIPPIAASLLVNNYILSMIYLRNTVNSCKSKCNIWL